MTTKKLATVVLGVCLGTTVLIVVTWPTLVHDIKVITDFWFGP